MLVPCNEDITQRTEGWGCGYDLVHVGVDIVKAVLHEVSDLEMQRNYMLIIKFFLTFKNEAEIKIEVEVSG